MKKLIITIIFVIMAAILTTPMAFAHEFIIKPVQTKIDPGKVLPFSVISAHSFMISEEMEPIDNVEVSLYDGDKIKSVKLHENKILMTLDGSVSPAGDKTSIIAGHRKPMIWTKTTQGWKQAGKSELTGVISSGQYEKFCKTMIFSKNSGKGYDKKVGHKLEIVPVSDPGSAVVGKEIEFLILYDGKPLSTNVYATYDGFSEQNNTYAYFTESSGEGRAMVKITHPGTWMIRVQHELNNATKDYDKHVMRSVLVFGVN